MTSPPQESLSKTNIAVLKLHLYVVYIQRSVDIANNRKLNALSAFHEAKESQTSDPAIPLPQITLPALGRCITSSG
jgi:hypothetical protein